METALSVFFPPSPLAGEGRGGKRRECNLAMRQVSASGQGNGLWRTAAVTFAGMLATGISAWLVFAQQVVTREEVIHMIARETPYLEDRKAIQEALSRNGEAINRMGTEIEKLRGQQCRLEIKIDALAGRLEKEFHGR